MPLADVVNKHPTIVGEFNRKVIVYGIIVEEHGSMRKDNVPFCIVLSMNSATDLPFSTGSFRADSNYD